MKVFIVLEPDADSYCGNWIQAVFSKKQSAENYVKKMKGYDFFIEEWEVDSE